jgi:hypothetical protein
MQNKSLVDISYARISTGNISQLSSLQNQIKILSKLKRGEIMTHIGSGGLEIPESLKNKILDEYNKKNEIRINVVGIDRLTRNFKDIDFLMKYVRYLYIVEEDKTYDMKHELKSIVSKIVLGVEELNTIKNRYNINNRKKRIRELDELNDNYNNNYNNYNNNERKISIQTRCSSFSNIILELGCSKIILENVEKVIRISQNLNCLGRWYEYFSLIEWFGLKDRKLEKCYKIYINQFSNNLVQKLENNMSFEIEKKDIVEIVNIIFEKNNISNKQIINKFINSNLIYGQLIKEDISELNIAINILSNLGLFYKSNNNHREIEKLFEFITVKKNIKKSKKIKLASINIGSNAKFGIDVRSEMRRIFCYNNLELELINNLNFYDILLSNMFDGLVFIVNYLNDEVIPTEYLIECYKIICARANVPFYIISFVDREIQFLSNTNNENTTILKSEGKNIIIKDKCDKIITWAKNLFEI